jgi:hypothetical protein
MTDLLKATRQKDTVMQRTSGGFTAMNWGLLWERNRLNLCFAGQRKSILFALKLEKWKY